MRIKTAMLAGCCAALVACTEPDTPGSEIADGMVVAVLSSAPDQVSGGTVLLALSGEGVREVAEQGRFQVAGRSLSVLRHTVRPTMNVPATDVPDTPPDETPTVHEILLAGLDLGVNDVDIQDAQGQSVASLTLTNHSASGPVFSGPQQYPFVCSSLREWGVQPLVDHEEEWGFPVYADIDENGQPQGQLLGYSKDCAIDTLIDYVYLNTDGDYLPLPTDGSRPEDMSRTVLADGSEVDFVVRWERGTLNRFLYSYAVLADADERADDPLQPGSIHWNGRLLYHFEGGVGIGHAQGRVNALRARLPEALARGYAVAYSSGNRTGEHYNLQLGGETALMVKEHFIKRFGQPDYTVGIGGSGGAIQQYIYQQNHPGLLDGGIAQYSYPDMVSQIIHVGDCELLEHYMDVTDRDNPRWRDTESRRLLVGLNATDDIPDPLADVKQQLGYSTAQGSTECLQAWRGLTPLAMNPHYGQVPDQGLMHPPGLMDDVVWTHYDDLRNILGVDADGWARMPWDNTGVQYGLQALRQGSLTPDEFLHLNAYVGGWKHPADMVQEGYPFLGDADAENFDPWSRRNMMLSSGGLEVAPRTRGDTQAIRALYESGMVFDGQLDIPVIDWRHYLEHVLDMHNVGQSFATRQRIENRMGQSDNQVLWVTDARPERIHDQTAMALEVMHDWLTNLKANPALSIAENRPAAAQDACFATDGTLLAQGDTVWDGVLASNADEAGEVSEVGEVREVGACTGQFPVYTTSRIQAGGPVEGSIFQCALKPVMTAITDGTYGEWQPDDEQAARLQEIFPDGVCDYSKPDQGRP